MKLTAFFIKHPVISLVLNAMILIVGLICLSSILVREYPEVELPVLTIQTNYPNASSELIETSITNILEDQFAGVENLESMTSWSSQGTSRIEMTFREGSSIDQAIIALRDAISAAKNNLPRDVLEPIIQRKTKSDGPPFIALSIFSPIRQFGDLTHFSNLFVKNNFRSLKGVSSVQIWGQNYTMAITLDTKKMYNFGVNADEIYTALEQNNISWPVGKFQDKIPTTMDLTLKNPDDFKNIFIKYSGKKPIYLCDIATVKLSTDTDSFRCRINGKPGLIISIERANDSNPIDVSNQVRQQIEILKKTLPNDIIVSLELDQSDFIRASLKNIKQSIIEAVFLVLAIVFLFLRTFRSTLIPLITIPISLIGSVIFLKIFGFSINTITLLAMVLAIGLVVDDAIVVLENIAHHIEKGLTPLAAALKGSNEIGLAIVAMTLTLASVYAPIAFIQGAIGHLFVEFAVTLAGSVLISGIVALTLSPLMCRYFIPPYDPQAIRLWPKIDHFLLNVENFYEKLLILSFMHTKKIFGLMISILVLMITFYTFLPKETAPKEDRGLMGVFVPYIPGNNLEQMENISILVENEIKDISEAQSLITFVGNWGGSVVLTFKPHNQRSRSPVSIMPSLQDRIKKFPSADAWVWTWDSGLPGLDDVLSGAELATMISTPSSYRDLLDVVNKARDYLEEKKLFKGIRHDLNLDTPGYSINIDEAVASRLGFQPLQISRLVEIFFSGKKNLNFQKENLLYPITIKGSGMPWSLNELYLTTPKGKRVSLGAFAKLEHASQAKELVHYNQMRSAKLIADLDESEKFGTNMSKLEKEAPTILPAGYKMEWVGAAKAFTKSATAMIMLFGMALLFIYAILSVQFENFLDPFIIMLTVPLACFGAISTLLVFGQSINIYSQIGLVTLIGLITKHGILIVEFVNQLLAEGIELQQAIFQAAHRRLRPILMTTGAMIFGSIPLIISGGAGSEARKCIGLVLVGGLIMGTFFTLLILPKFCYLIKSRVKPVK